MLTVTSTFLRHLFAQWLRTLIDKYLLSQEKKTPFHSLLSSTVISIQGFKIGEFISCKVN